MDEKVTVVLKMKIEKVSGNTKWSDGWFMSPFLCSAVIPSFTPPNHTENIHDHWYIILLSSSWVFLHTKTNALRERLATLKEQRKAREEELSNHRRRTFA